MTTDWTLIRTSAPSVLPVSLSEVKSHLRLSSSDTTHDTNLTLLIEAAVERLEQDLDRQVITASFRITRFNWGSDTAEVKLHKKAVSSVTSVEYVDVDGNDVTLATDKYILDKGRCSIFPAAGTTWPEVYADDPSGVAIDFCAGYGSEASCVPSLFKTAIMLGVGKWFFDPAQEGSALHSQEVAYERIVALLARSSYP
jgi:uncharacterized phiE125 gp8 family phage protein